MAQHTRPDAPIADEQVAEVERVHAAPAAPPMTSGQWHGLWVGVLIGGAIGAVLGGLLGLIPFADLDVGLRVLITALAGAIAGGTAGAVYFGGRVPELEGETTDADGSPSIGSSPRDPGATDSTGRRH